MKTTLLSYVSVCEVGALTNTCNHKSVIYLYGVKTAHVVKCRQGSACGAQDVRRSEYE